MRFSHYESNMMFLNTNYSFLYLVEREQPSKPHLYPVIVYIFSKLMISEEEEGKIMASLTHDNTDAVHAEDLNFFGYFMPLYCK
jgi:hypothetical protein